MDQYYGIAIGGTLTLLGVLVPTIFNWLNSKGQRKAEEKRYRRELVFKIGFDLWLHHLEFSKYLNERFKKEATMHPPETYVLHFSKFLDLFDEELSSADLEKRIRENHEFTKRIEQLMLELEKEHEVTLRKRE